MSVWLVPLQVSANQIEVDVELVLAVDVSRSMSMEELEIQRDGYVEALRDLRVAKAARSGPLGRIALQYVEWAGTQSVVVDWTLIETAADLEAFAARLTVQFDNRLRRTSISGVIDASLTSLQTNQFRGSRQVVDISGDGPNNLGLPVREARNRASEAGITINGLPLMTEGRLSRFGIANLDEYYRNCVVTGAGHFIVPVTSWAEFPAAVRKKLVQELVARPDTVIQAQFKDDASDYECLVGERQWERFAPFLR